MSVINEAMSIKSATVIVLFLTTAAISILWGGYVALELWGWFIVPLGVSPITLPYAIGINCLIYTFLGGRGCNLSKDGKVGFDVVFKGITCSLTAPLITLTVGWFVQKFML